MFTTLVETYTEIDFPKYGAIERYDEFARFGESGENISSYPVIIS